MRILSVPLVLITNSSVLCSYLTIPRYSASPEVPSEKKIFPSPVVPERIVIPQVPVSATVKLSAVVFPSTSVPIPTLPLK